VSTRAGQVQNRSVIDFFHRLAHRYAGMTWVGKGLAVLILCVVTTAFGLAVVVWLPADHFSRPPRSDSGWRRHPVLRWSAVILKNAVGIVLLPLGILMALPLVPGPGMVFILVGLSLLDFPGKRSLEKKLLSMPRVQGFLNEVRERFGKPPLIIDAEAR
jgi:hypothetical protein